MRTNDMQSPLTFSISHLLLIFLIAGCLAAWWNDRNTQQRNIKIEAEYQQILRGEIYKSPNGFVLGCEAAEPLSASSVQLKNSLTNNQFKFLNLLELIQHLSLIHI